ncbi:MAG: C-terminal binding protein [Candidatus Rariloculaceae bacterium]
MSDKAKVVLTDYVWESLDVEHEILGDLADIVPIQETDPEKFFPEAAYCDALLNTYGGPISADVMAKMPNCRVISRYGIGVDTIDLDAATDAGIIVTNNPTYCVEEVAEHTIAMLLTSARKIAFYDRLVRAGRWEVPPGKPMFRLAGSTCGLVGFGNIARRVAKAAAGLDMRVIYSDPFVEPGQFDAPGEKVEFDQLLAESDFVCIHAPLLPQTKGMVGADQFAQMKDTAVIVNCSRGPIINTDALVSALDSGAIAGCALDTTDPEPLTEDHALRNRENVIINPHAAWYSEQAMAGLQAGAPNEVKLVLQGEWPTNVVNKAVKDNNRAGI